MSMSEALCFQVSWLFNNEPVVSPDYQISAFGDNHSLYIPEVFDEDAGRFSVSAENEAGKATCSALLVVVDASAAPPQVPSSPPYVKVSGCSQRAKWLSVLKRKRIHKNGGLKKKFFDFQVK